MVHELKEIEELKHRKDNIEHHLVLQIAFSGHALVSSLFFFF